MLAAKEFEGLLRVQGILFTLGHMHPPQEDQPEIVRDLQKQGFSTIVLTARGPQFRDVTMRELGRTGFCFGEAAPAVDASFRGMFLPYQSKEITASGLSAKEAERLHLGPPQKVCYDTGVFMATGQDKGAMLLIFLAHCPRYFSAIVFVDDQAKNTQSVFRALTGRGIEVTTYRYGGEDRNVARFQEQQQRTSVKQWQELQRLRNSIFRQKEP
jgi:hypothetical protein